MAALIFVGAVTPWELDTVLTGALLACCCITRADDEELLLITGVVLVSLLLVILPSLSSLLRTPSPPLSSFLEMLEELSSLLSMRDLSPSPEGLCLDVSPWDRCTSSALCLAPVHSRSEVRGTARSKEELTCR